MRQLFEPPLRQLSRRERDQLLRGAASLAADVLGTRDRSPMRAEVRVPDALHGLYWLTLNLAERAPLVMMIDDAQWADRASLRFLAYLAGRLEGVGVLLLVARRGGARADDDLLSRCMQERGTRMMGLRPLSLVATTELLRNEYQEEVAPGSAEACRDATGGNPLYLRELVRALRADAIAPTAAGASRVAGQGPASVARSVLTRIAVLSPAAAGVARALALLGGEAGIPGLTELSALDNDSVVATVDHLTGAEITVGVDPVSFAHPIVHASIYTDIPDGERARGHLRAARLLANAGVAAEQVAAHLVAARSAGDPWAVSVLSKAAADALSRGAPDSAVRI